MSTREQIAEALLWSLNAQQTIDEHEAAAVLAPLVDRLCAEALEAAATKIAELCADPVPAIADPYDAVVILRARARAIRGATA